MDRLDEMAAFAAVADARSFTQGAKRIVYVAGPGGVVGVRVVELGPLSGGLRVIRAGLSPSDLVIIEGQQRARPGQKVAPKLGRIRHEDVDQGLPTVVLPPAGSATPVSGP